jgi:hypothetical protein
MNLYISRKIKFLTIKAKYNLGGPYYMDMDNSTPDRLADYVD